MPTRTQPSHRHADAHVQTTHTRLSIPTSTRKHTHAHKHTHTQTQLPTQNKRTRSYSVSETKKTDHRTNLRKITTYTHIHTHMRTRESTHTYKRTRTHKHYLACKDTAAAKVIKKSANPSPRFARPVRSCLSLVFQKKKLGNQKNQEYTAISITVPCCCACACMDSACVDRCVRAQYVVQACAIGGCVCMCSSTYVHSVISALVEMLTLPVLMNFDTRCAVFFQ